MFSLDAFISLALMLLAMQSLIFVYAYPLGFLDHFLAAQRLAKDLLITFSYLKGSDLGVSGLYNNTPGWYYIVDQRAVVDYLNNTIPSSFAYMVFYRRGDGSWVKVYNSADYVSGRPKPIGFFNVSVTIPIYVQNHEEEGTESCYGYNTCKGEGTLCDFPVSTYKPPEQEEYEIKVVIMR